MAKADKRYEIVVLVGPCAEGEAYRLAEDITDELPALPHGAVSVREYKDPAKTLVTPVAIGSGGKVFRGPDPKPGSGKEKR